MAELAPALVTCEEILIAKNSSNMTALEQHVKRAAFHVWGQEILPFLLYAAGIEDYYEPHWTTLSKA